MAAMPDEEQADPAAQGHRGQHAPAGASTSHSQALFSGNRFSLYWVIFSQPMLLA